jgi:hypothetical protein
MVYRIRSAVWYTVAGLGSKVQTQIIFSKNGEVVGSWKKCQSRNRRKALRGRTTGVQCYHNIAVNKIEFRCLKSFL